MSAHLLKTHALMAAAAASAVTANLIAMAAIMDWLPGSHRDNVYRASVSAVPPVTNPAQAITPPQNPRPAPSTQPRESEK